MSPTTVVVDLLWQARYASGKTYHGMVGLPLRTPVDQRVELPLSQSHVGFCGQVYAQVWNVRHNSILGRAHVCLAPHKRRG